MQHSRGDRDPVFRKWLVLGILISAAIIVSGTVYVLAAVRTGSTSG